MRNGIPSLLFFTLEEMLKSYKKFSRTFLFFIKFSKKNYIQYKILTFAAIAADLVKQSVN